MQNSTPPLGGMSVDEFMRHHWQRKPLLIRNAIPGFQPLLSRDALIELAGQDDVESRLVSLRGRRWSLQHGPFERDQLPARTRRAWSLLVQGVDTQLDAAHDLLARFRFVADVRLDDLMISYASDGGGVGPHLDSYDVFLLQAHGRRRWRIAAPRPAELLPDAPLRILSNFEPESEWVLEPGDMLYLPPQWAHEGTALGECMTCSIGFRAPSRHELLRGFLADAADALDGADPRYGDDGQAPTRKPGQIPAAMAQTLAGWLADWRPSRARIDDYLGRFLTEPKPSVWFEPPARPLAPGPWWKKAQRLGLRADRRTRLAYRGRHVFINGESVDAGPAALVLLRRLADTRQLPAAGLQSAECDEPTADTLYDWFCAGWIQFGATP